MPLLPVAVALVVGIVCERYFVGADYAVVIALCVALALLFTRHRYLALIIISVCTGWCASLVDGYRYQTDGTLGDGSPRTVAGTVERVSDTSESRKVTVRLDTSPGGVCYLTVVGFDGELVPGDNVCFSAELEPVVDCPAADGRLDMRNFYYRNHISSTATCEPGEIRVVGHDDSLRWRLYRQRERFADLIACSNLNETTCGFLTALLLGDDSMLDAETRPQFAASGLAHLLALSGMHVAVIAWLLSVVLFPLAAVGHRRAMWLAVIAFIWWYAMLTGMAPSVTRAAIMFTVLILSRIFYRTYASANALFFAAIAILVCSPRQLFTPGFQLSFMAILALVTLPAVMRSGRPRYWIVRWFKNYLVFTFAAVMGTMFLVIYYFHTLPVYFLIANIPCAFLVPIILGGGIVVVFLQVFGMQWGVADYVTDGATRLLSEIARVIPELPGATVDNLYLPVWGVVAGYIMLACVVAFLYYRRMGLVISAVVAFVVLVCGFVIERESGGELLVDSSPRATDIIVTSRDDNHALLVSSVRSRDLPAEIDDINRRFADFRGRRGIEAIDNRDAVAVEGSVVISHSVGRVAVINSDDLPADSLVSVRYVIVCRGFKGDIVEMCSRFECDSVFLGADINAIRRRRYESELVEAGISVRQLSRYQGLKME